MVHDVFEVQNKTLNDESIIDLEFKKDKEFNGMSLLIEV